MSSTSSTTPASSGECVVCGQVTTTRCSSCASHGLGWMYFCGKEHQKLIWKTHKRHCGTLSQVWRWPGLNPKEIKLFNRLVNIPLEIYQGRTWGEDAAKRGDPFMPNFFEWLGEDQARDLTSEQLDGRSKISAIIRDQAFLVEIALLKKSKIIGDLDDSFFEPNPYGRLVRFEDSRWEELVTDINSDWSNELQHRILIFFDLYTQKINVSTIFDILKGKAGVSHEMIKHAYEQVEKVCRRRVPEQYANKADSFLKALKELRGDKL